MLSRCNRTKSFAFIQTLFFLGISLFLSSCGNKPQGLTEKAAAHTVRGVVSGTKETWAEQYDTQSNFRTAEWNNYLNLPFDPNQSQTGLFSSVDSAVTSFDYGLYNPNLGGGHIARAAQHLLTYGFGVGRQCLEEAIVDYLNANQITVAPDKFLYQQGFWPMRKAGIVSGDSQLTKVSKALKSLHGGDLIYSRLSSSGPEDKAEIVSFSCTLCHESRALVPTGSGKFKAVRQPWGAEGYISKNLKLMSVVTQNAVMKAASGSVCASGPEKWIYASLYQAQISQHESISPEGITQTVNLDPHRMVTLTPDTSFYNPSGQYAHSVLNLLVNRGSWYKGKPDNIDQAFQMFRPEDVLTNNKFYGILNANFNHLYGLNVDGSPAPVNFHMNSAWGQKFYYNGENMFHGMGCTAVRADGTIERSSCNTVEKTILLSAATQSQAVNPDLTSNTIALFPGTTTDYKLPLRRFSGTDGVFERTAELFIGIDNNAGNPAVPEIASQRNMTWESIEAGIYTYNERCADCHGQAQIGLPGASGAPSNVAPIYPGFVDSTKFVEGSLDMPLRAYIANLRNQPYVPVDAVADLPLKEYDNYRGDLYYGALPNPKKYNVKNLVGIALEQRFGCYLSMSEFLSRSTPHAIQVTTSKLNVTNLGYVKQKTYQYETGTNEQAAQNSYPRFNIFFQKQHPECGSLTSSGGSNPTLFYDHPFHGTRLGSGNSLAPLTATQIKQMIDYFVAISFENTSVTKAGAPIKLRIYRGSGSFGGRELAQNGFLDGSLCRNKCAKAGDPCDPAVEHNPSALRYCCGSKDDTLAARATYSLNCGIAFQNGLSDPGPPTWGYAGDEDDCFTAYPPIYPERKCRYMAPPGSTCYNPDSTFTLVANAQGACEVDKLPRGGWASVVSSPTPSPTIEYTCTGGDTCPSGMSCQSGVCVASSGTTVSSVSPASGTIGSSVTIYGTNFTGATAVGFNGQNATSFSVVSSTQITATVPVGAATGYISVTPSSGPVVTSSTVFSVLSPTVSGFSPASGNVGASVVINGANFTGATSVAFDGKSASFVVNSENQITATVPATATTGIITITSSAGSGHSPTSFNVTVPVSISSFSPNYGPVGTSVTINGSGFAAVTGVLFNGTSASYSYVDSTKIVATVPIGATTGKITLTTNNQGTPSSSTDFTVNATVSSFSPTSGTVGTSVTLTGANFLGATAVKFGSSNAQFTVNSNTQITTTVPSGASTSLISVTTPAGTFSSSTSFVISGSSAPAITSFSTNNIPAGTTFTINGVNFGSPVSVTFTANYGSTVTVSGTLVSANAVSVTVPDAAITGPVKVTVPSGMATSPTNLTVTCTALFDRNMACDDGISACCY